MVITLLLAVPFAGALACLLVRSRRWVEITALVASALTLVFGLAAAIRPFQTGAFSAAGDLVYLDSLGAVFLSIVVVIVFLATLYSIPYLAHDLADGTITEKQLPGYYAAMLAFEGTLVLTCVLNNLGLLWASIEATTIISAWLVAIHHSKAALEAAWKYLLLCSAGIILALFGVFLFYVAAVQTLGPESAPLEWSALMPVAKHLDPALVKVAFAFVFVGLGAKAGFAPLHTWLPDAHSQAPTPVSAVLSSVLLSCALYGILRFHLITSEVVGPAFSQQFFLGFGLLSVVVATPFMLLQRDLKRLLAYSSVEHIGLTAVAIGIGGPIGLFAAVLHIILHALAKTLLFFVSGTLVQQFHTRRIAGIRGVITASPLTGVALLIGAIAITGTPPLALFVSETSILLAGVQQGLGAVTIVLIVALTLVFVAVFSHVLKMTFGTPPVARMAPGRRSSWLLSGLAPVVMLMIGGVALPSPLVTAIDQAARILGSQP